MSFKHNKPTIEEGDTVIVYLSNAELFSMHAVARTNSKKGHPIDNVLQTTKGALKGADLIGKRYGCQVDLSNGWAYVLQPTPELWTLSLPHRTQIIHTADISMIILQLELSTDSVVLEAGTGSGSLSHALIRAIQPNGHLHTFDFHEDRASLARQEFSTHGLADFVSVACRDVIAQGFGDELRSKADAVFLDLPSPHLAVEKAVEAFRPEGGRICTFSPCIEQVQKTCNCLQKLGFQDIQTLELVQTQFAVVEKSQKVLDLQSKNFGHVEAGRTEKLVSAIPPQSQTGHTGFLSVATYPPKWALDDK